MLWQTRLYGCLGLSLFTVLGCKRDTPPEPLPPPPTAAPAPSAQQTPPAEPEPVVPVRISEVGFDTPESVIHDEQADVYLVSNIGGNPLEKDGNGFISRVTPEGKVQTLKWIDGSVKGTTLNAPKGMGLQGETLYVADIDVVRMFDRQTGKPKGEVKIKGATFLNDLAASGDRLVVSDSGLKAGFAPSGTDAVYELKAGKAKPIVKDSSLFGPNGLALDGDDVWVAAYRAKTLSRINGGKVVESFDLPQGELDGLVRLADGTFLVSSWAAKAVYQGRPGSGFEPIVSGVEAPADIGHDAKRNQLLIPLFQKNAVEIHPL